MPSIHAALGTSAGRRSTLSTATGRPVSPQAQNDESWMFLASSPYAQERLRPQREQVSPGVSPVSSLSRIARAIFRMVSRNVGVSSAPPLARC